MPGTEVLVPRCITFYKVRPAKNEAGEDGYRAYWYDVRRKDEPDSKATNPVVTCPWRPTRQAVRATMENLFDDVMEWGVNVPLHIEGDRS